MNTIETLDIADVIASYYNAAEDKLPLSSKSNIMKNLKMLSLINNTDNLETSMACPYLVVGDFVVVTDEKDSQKRENKTEHYAKYFFGENSTYHKFIKNFLKGRKEYGYHMNFFNFYFTNGELNCHKDPNPRKYLPLKEYVKDYIDVIYPALASDAPEHFKDQVQSGYHFYNNMLTTIEKKVRFLFGHFFENISVSLTYSSDTKKSYKGRAQSGIRYYNKEEGIEEFIQFLETTEIIFPLVIETEVHNFIHNLNSSLHLETEEDNLQSLENFKEMYHTRSTVLPKESLQYRLELTRTILSNLPEII